MEFRFPGVRLDFIPTVGSGMNSSSSVPCADTCFVDTFGCPVRRQFTFSIQGSLVSRLVRVGP